MSGRCIRSSQPSNSAAAAGSIRCDDVSAVYHVSGQRPMLTVQAYVVDLGALRDVPDQRRGNGVRKVRRFKYLNVLGRTENQKGSPGIDM